MRLPWRSSTPPASPSCRSSSRPTASRPTSPPASTRCSRRPGGPGRRSSSTTDRRTAAGRSPRSTPHGTRASRSCTCPTAAWAPPATWGPRTRPASSWRSSTPTTCCHRRHCRCSSAPCRSRAPTSRPARSCGGRADGLHEPPWMRRLHARAHGSADRGAPRDPRRRLRVEQGLPPLLLGRRRPRLARGHPLRGPAHDHPRLHGRHLRRAADHRLPLAHPRRRLLDHPAARLGPRPRRPLGDQADVVRRSPLGRRRGRRGRVRRPGARRRPVALLPGDPRLPRTSGGRCSATECGSSGASGRWCTAGCRRCTGSAAGWSSRTGARTPPR